ncbi:hypothetical protein ScPMuIL_011840 [Solemya velum]
MNSSRHRAVNALPRILFLILLTVPSAELVLGGTCTTDECGADMDCEDVGGTKRCVCADTHYGYNGTCTIKLGFGGNCTDGIECGANMKCDAGGTDKCVCAGTHYNNIGTCTIKPTHNEICSDSAVCKDGIGLTCTGTDSKLCTCANTHYWDSTTCTTKPTHHETCSDTAVCKIGDGLTCTGTGSKLCTCADTDYWDSTNCMTKPSYGEICSDTAVCKTGAKLTCVGPGSKICTCADTSYWDSTTCKTTPKTEKKIKLKMTLDIVVEDTWLAAEANGRNANWTKARDSSKASLETLYNATIKAFLSVQIKQLTLGSLIVDHEIIVNNTDTVDQEVAVTMDKVLTGNKTITYDNQTAHLTSIEYTDPETDKTVKITETDVKDKCSVFVTMGVCEPNQRCAIVANEPVCHCDCLYSILDNFDMILGLGLGVPVFLLVCLAFALLLAKSRIPHRIKGRLPRAQEAYDNGYFPTSMPRRFDRNNPKQGAPQRRWETETEFSENKYDQRRSYKPRRDDDAYLDSGADIDAQRKHTYRLRVSLVFD